ncbi:hypothetical protein MMC17_002055 [Xylographa soralifera]|nr:hypothetical protein [Xylographa soralifera]
MEFTMADKVEENMNVDTILVPKNEDIMESTTTNNVEANNDVDATPILGEKPLFYVSSFEPSARVTKLLNEVVAQKAIKKLEDTTYLSEDVPSACPTPACNTSSPSLSIFQSSYISPPTPEISTTIVDVAMQDDTTCLTPACLTIESLASTPLSEVLSDHFHIPSPKHETSSSQAAGSPKMGQIMNITKNNVEDTLFSTSAASNEKIAPHLNATNQYIVHLRDETNFGWAHIAAMLNGQPATHPPPESGTSGTSATPFLPSAVYSRYIRTKYHLRVAAEAAEILARQQAKSTKRKRPAARRGSTVTVDSNDSDYSASEQVSQRPKVVHTTAAKGPVVWEEQMDKLLRDAVKEVKSEFWEGVAKRVVEKKGSGVQPSECAKRFVEVEK